MSELQHPCMNYSTILIRPHTTTEKKYISARKLCYRSGARYIGDVDSSISSQCEVQFAECGARLYDFRSPHLSKKGKWCLSWGRSCRTLDTMSRSYPQVTN